MLFKYIKRICRYGTSPRNESWRNRSILTTNSIALSTGFIAFLSGMANFASDGFVNAVFITLALTLFFLFIPFISKLGHSNVTRFLLTTVTIFGVLAVTIARKAGLESNPPIETFYQSRAVLLIFSAIPFAVFNFREPVKLATSSFIALLGLLLYDPIHNLFGVGYYQLGFTAPHYYITNLYFFLGYLFLTSVMLFFKKIMEEYEVQNEMLLHAQQQRNELIEKQKQELEYKTLLLNQLLSDKDKDLQSVTEQLGQFNQDLLHYSYALSHNMRGPVATLMGLSGLLKQANTEEEVKYLLALSDERLGALDSIIHDLVKMVETRTDSFHIRKQVKLQSIMQEAMQLLDSPIRSNGVKIISDFGKAPALLTSESRIRHILVTLLTNAIQYRKPDETLIIRINSHRQNGFVVLEVEDNGKGIDLEKFGRDIFKPFKRFDVESSGKGMGLYVLKLQVDKLHGKIEVKSTPGMGTVFTVYVKEIDLTSPSGEG